MLTQVEVRTAMYTLHFLKSEWHLELDIRSRVSVVSQFHDRDSDTSHRPNLGLDAISNE